MGILQKLDILSLGRLKTEAVQVEGGDEIIISEMGASDSYVLFSDPALQDSTGNMNMSVFAPALLARCIVDSSGSRIFNDEDIATLSRLPAELFNQLGSVALRLNGISPESQAEEIKNCVPSPE
jgi:hypothetical protein